MKWNIGSSAHSGKYPRFGVCVRAKPAHTPQIWGIIPLKPEYFLTNTGLGSKIAGATHLEKEKQS
jgi:hypothetical protein